MLRRAATLFALVASAPFASAQVTLAEAPAAGECFRYGIELELAGRMTINQEGTKQTIRLEAKARHAFADRTLAVADGGHLANYRLRQLLRRGGGDKGMGLGLAIVQRVLARLGGRLRLSGPPTTFSLQLPAKPAREHEHAAID